MITLRLIVEGREIWRATGPEYDGVLRAWNESQQFTVADHCILEFNDGTTVRNFIIASRAYADTHPL